MITRRSFFLLLAVLGPALVGQNGQRSLRHQDYDGWRSISNFRLSPDGKFLAYGVFPQEGDGEVVVRNLATGAETRADAGVRPAAPRPDPLAPEGTPPPARGVTMTFSEDSRTLVFLSFPTRVENDLARKEQRTTPEQAPRNAMVIIDLAAGKAERIARIRSFQMPARAAGWLAYLREGPETKPDAAKKGEGAPPQEQDGDQRGGTRSGASSRTASARRPEFGTELVLRKLANGSEKSFAGVVEYSLSEDGATLVYAVAQRDASNNGVFAARTAEAGEPAALLQGKGKYAKLTWDEKQAQLAFLSDRDDAAAKQPKFKLYRWDRKASGAAEIVSASTPGFRPGFAISDKGTIAFSSDARSVFFGTAPPPAPARPASTSEGPAPERAVVDLWHWKDDYIQPMQKVRAERDRSKTYTAAYSLAENKVVQLGDTSLPDIVAGEGEEYVLGRDDRAYRRIAEYDERYADAWIVNLATGQRTLAARKHRGTLSLSPGGRYTVMFDGKDWISIAIPSGRQTNLTAKLGVKFANEDYDSPGSPPGYGVGGWTRDGRWLLLFDRFDVWQVAPDGSAAINLTAGAGRRRGLQFRPVRFADEGNPRDRWFDPVGPLLLRAENLDTRATGFWRTAFGASSEPVQLLMEARNFSVPVKAKKADVYVLTAQTFRECPDLIATDAAFRNMRKVSRINPQQDQFLWGSAEMIHFKNTDGVPLSGVLFKPDRFDPKKKYPMLVYIYERLSQQLNHYVEPRPGTSINIAYYVSNGYLVLTPDIAYTIGYPGQSALKAVLPAVQAVVDQGFVDEKAIGIQGHSWGGYQIAYMITQTNRFRAVEAGAPVADMISAYNGIRWGPGLPRQFQYERTQSRIGGSIWQYPTRFIENSPIFWADRVQTPVMILHNDGDDAVPWYQGIEFYLALRRLGKEVYLFDYNGEPHGLHKRPNQKDYTVRMQQYFDHYLKGAPEPEWMEKGVPYLQRDRQTEAVDVRP